MIATGTPSPAMNALAPSAMMTSTDAGQRLGLRGQQVDAERLVGQLLDPPHLVADRPRRQPRHAERSEAARRADTPRRPRRS